MNSKSITKDHIKKFFSNIVRIRRIEQAIAERYHLGEMKCPMHLSVGQEGPDRHFNVSKSCRQNAQHT